MIDSVILFFRLVSAENVLSMFMADEVVAVQTFPLFQGPARTKHSPNNRLVLVWGK
jgi:hypothetical protein